MRHLALAFLVLATVSCGDEGNGNDMSMDMLPPDLNMEDLTTPPDFAGVGCGTMTCDTTAQECCATLNGTTLDTTCVAKGACNKDMGAVIACDGPEDCAGLTSATNAGCCISLAGQTGMPDSGTVTSGSGSSTCTNNCVGEANYDGANFTATTKLCHTKTDCTGYMGTLNFMGTPVPQSFGSCCQAQMTGAYRFCFNSMTASAIGANCTF
jgi:hypothetical protein